MDTLHQVAYQTNFQKKIMSAEPNTITCLAGGEEMIRVGSEGFWVRGIKVEQDAQEAQAVYNAFKQWMAWASLQGRY